MLHIDLPTRAEIERLAAYRKSPAVSIYLATHPVTQQADADRLQLARLLKEAVDQMEKGGVDKRSIWPIEEAVQELVDDPDFWDVQANSLAVLATPEQTRTFRLPNRLQNVAEVSDRFHLKPLIRAVTFPHNAYVLAYSVGRVRLVEVTADLPAREIKVQGLPKDLNDALGKASRAASQGAVRSGRHISEGEFFRRYARTVDAALRPFLQGHERPLIIASPEPHGSIYRSVSSYPHTAERIVSGNFDGAPEHELATAARSVLDEVYADEIKALHGLFAERQGQGRATGDIAQAARAATFGAVDTLIFDMDEVVHGTVNDEDGGIAFAETASAQNYGIVDEIAARALRTGARLLAGRKDDIPGGGSLAAILRYPI
jgi:peptide subunit release factor 1 (eRF1)